MIDIKKFDVVAYLEDKSIPFWTHGRNVQKGWIGMTCLFCGDHYHSGNNHLGINKNTKMYYCWICRQKGSVTDIIEVIEECSKTEAFRIVSQYMTYEHIEEYHNEDNTKFIDNLYNSLNRSTKLPKEILPHFPKTHLKYLKSRRFNPEEIIPQYNLFATTVSIKYKQRIVIPVFAENNLLTFTTRDITGIVENKYRSQSSKDAIVPIKYCLYNIDRVDYKGKVVLVEGVTDVWRIGKSAVAVFGVNWKDEQLFWLKKKMVKEAFVLFDSESNAQKNADKLGIALQTFVNHVEIIKLDDGDPADMSDSDVKYLKKEIGL